MEKRTTLTKLSHLIKGFTPHFISVKLYHALDAALAIGLGLGLLFALKTHLLQPAKPRPSPTSINTAAPYDALAAIRQVQDLPLYRQAQALYQKHYYQKAAQLLKRIPCQLALNPTQNAFLQDQIQLCLYPQTTLHSQHQPATPTQSPVQADCGPRALLLVCRALGLHPSLQKLRRLCHTTSRGTTLLALAQAAQALGLQATGIQTGPNALPYLPMPAIAWVNENHFIAVYALGNDPKHPTARIQDPNAGVAQTISQARLLNLSGGYLLLVRKPPVWKATKRFGRAQLRIQPAS